MKLYKPNGISIFFWFMIGIGLWLQPAWGKTENKNQDVLAAERVENTRSDFHDSIYDIRFSHLHKSAFAAAPNSDDFRHNANCQFLW